MEERLQAEWSNHLPDQAEKEQAISKLATQVEEQVRKRYGYLYFCALSCTLWRCERLIVKYEYRSSSLE